VICFKVQHLYQPLSAALHMKKLNFLITLILILGISLTTTSCVIMTKHDNGHHKGWYKNSNKSHPSSSKPGRGKH
jgi:hypothetical protein